MSRGDDKIASIADRSYEDTLKILRKLSVDNEDLPEDELAAVNNELDAIEDFESKLTQMEFGIAAFGEVNAGKSRLLNALVGQDVFGFSARGGETKEARSADWDFVTVVPSLTGEGSEGHRLYVIDTPGLNEVKGEGRDQLARETVRYADIVLFVVQADLRQSELEAIHWLCDLNKPMLLVLNKIDSMTEEQIAQTHEAIRQKVGDIFSEDAIVHAAGGPMPITTIFREADGTDRKEITTPDPIIDDLKVRILQVVGKEGKAIAALNASLFASDVSGRIAELKQEYRGSAAQKTIQNHMILKALGVAANPIPVADIIAAVAFDGHMIVKLGLVYGQSVNLKTARSLGREIMAAWGATAAVEWLTHISASALKLATFGSSALLTAAPQAITAAWSTHIVGNAAAFFFREGGWGADGPQAVVQRILSQTDKDSVLKPLEDRFIEKLSADKKKDDLSEVPA